MSGLGGGSLPPGKSAARTLRKAERQSGVPNAHISQLETGTIRHPGVSILIRLSAASGIPLPELLALACRADFGTVGEDGGLEDHEGHEMSTMAVWLPRKTTKARHVSG